MNNVNNAIVAMRMEGVGPNEIAAKLSHSVKHVKNIIADRSAAGVLFPPIRMIDDLGRRSVNVRHQFNADATTAVCRAAKRRKITVEQLVVRLLDVLGDEPSLIDSVLDDQE